MRLKLLSPGEMSADQKQTYDESIFTRMEEAHAKRQQQRLQRQASALGFALTPLPSEACA